MLLLLFITDAETLMIFKQQTDIEIYFTFRVIFVQLSWVTVYLRPTETDASSSFLGCKEEPVSIRKKVTNMPIQYEYKTPDLNQEVSQRIKPASKGGI